MILQEIGIGLDGQEILMEYVRRSEYAKTVTTLIENIELKFHLRMGEKYLLAKKRRLKISNSS
jgi:hypothetical protein